MDANTALITNDAAVLGLLLGILAFVFHTSSSDAPFWKKFYKFVPALLLCYFIPSIFNSLGIISGEHSQLYFVSSRYLLPSTLVLLTLSIDLPGIARLGPKALIMFFTATIGIVLGGPLAIIIVGWLNPEILGGQGPDAVWRGLSTVAGSWIGGGANQAAMKEVFEVNDRLFSQMITVDVLVANVWMAVLLFMAGESKAIDARTGADASAIERLRHSVEAYAKKISRIPTLPDTMKVLFAGFGVTALAHLGADAIAPWIARNMPAMERLSLTSGFFWLIVLATTGGVILSFTPARRLEGVGASRIGSAMLYVLVASIGMKMDLVAIKDAPWLFLIGAIWLGFHGILLLVVGRIIRAPVFFIAVGSQANVGGAASAPIVASAFHPALAPVGVLLAVLGYALGTYGAWLCAQLMRIASS